MRWLVLTCYTVKVCSDTLLSKQGMIKESLFSLQLQCIKILAFSKMKKYLHTATLAFGQIFERQFASQWSNSNYMSESV